MHSTTAHSIIIPSGSAGLGQFWGSPRMMPWTVLRSTAQMSRRVPMCVCMAVRTHLYLSFTLGYNLIQPHLLCGSNCSTFDHWELLWLAPLFFSLKNISFALFSLSSSGILITCILPLWYCPRVLEFCSFYFFCLHISVLKVSIFKLTDSFLICGESTESIKGFFITVFYF